LSTGAPTEPIREQTGAYRVPMMALTHWPRATVTGLWRNLIRRAGSPWGRLAGGAAVGYVFVFRPTTGGGLVVVALLTAVTAFATRRPSVYAVPAFAVAVQMGSVEWGLATLGALLGGRWWATRSDKPDPIALRLHLALAERTKAPTKETIKRLETFNEARNRIIYTGRLRVLPGQFRRLLVPDQRMLNPVPTWIYVIHAPPDAAYEIEGGRFSYPPTLLDADPTWRQATLDALAHKLPKMPDGSIPGVIGEWHEDQDYCNWRVARPMPRWVDITELPELPFRDVVPLGATSPDSPMVAELEGFPLALWNFDNDQVAQDYGITPEPNAIVIGPPGSFKTTAGRTIANGALRYLGARLHIIDGKGEGAFAYLDGQDGVLETADAQKGKQLVLQDWEEMQARYAVNDRRYRRGQRPVRYRPILLMIDEGMSWLDQLADDADFKQEFLVKLVDIARKGRTARMGIVWMTQRPDVQGVAAAGTVGQMRDSLGLKLAGAGTTETGARMIYGDSNGQLAGLIPKTPRARMGMMVGSTFQLIQLAYTPNPLHRHDPDEPVEWIDLATDQPPPEPRPRPAGNVHPFPERPNGGRILTP
jgi:hypothetical protein